MLAFATNSTRQHVSPAKACAIAPICIPMYPHTCTISCGCLYAHLFDPHDRHRQAPPYTGPFGMSLTPFRMLTLPRIDRHNPPSLLTATNVVLALMLLAPLARRTAMPSSLSFVISTPRPAIFEAVSYRPLAHLSRSGKRLARAHPRFARTRPLVLGYQTLACHYPRPRE